MRRRVILASLAVPVFGAAGWFATQPPKALSTEQLSALYATPLPQPSGPMSVFHLGHSLVGRDMPAMLAQLAGHDHASQLGWGTPLKAHWEPDEPI